MQRLASALTKSTSHTVKHQRGDGELSPEACTISEAKSLVQRVSAGPKRVSRTIHSAYVIEFSSGTNNEVSYVYRSGFHQRVCNDVSLNSKHNGQPQCSSSTKGT